MKYNPFKSDVRNKYKKHGAYHWEWYENKPSYREGVDFLKKLIVEKNVLDVGAGDGLIAHVLGIRGVDIDKDGIAAAKSMGAVVDFGDAVNLPYKDEEFDAVLMYDTVEHLELPIQAFIEAKRVLKTHLYIVVPNIEGDFVTDESKLKEMVEGVGFQLSGDIIVKKVRNGKQFFAKFKKI